MKFKKIVCAIIITVTALFCVGCSEADRVNHNISKQANYFETERRITVYNARTDKIILEAEGLMSISNNSETILYVLLRQGQTLIRKIIFI